MIGIKLLHVLAPECQLQGIYLNKGTEVQCTNLGIDRTHWCH